MAKQKLKSGTTRVKTGAVKAQQGLVIRVGKLVFSPVKVLDQVGQLQERDQKVLLEKYVHRRSKAEIARQLKVAQQTVTRRLRQAEARLGQALEESSEAADDSGTGSEWTREKDARRCELIDREIDGTLTVEEQSELNQLQNEMLARRRAVAPLPIEAARELHAELMEGLAEQ